MKCFCYPIINQKIISMLALYCADGFFLAADPSLKECCYCIFFIFFLENKMNYLFICKSTWSSWTPEQNYRLMSSLMLNSCKRQSTESRQNSLISDFKAELTKLTEIKTLRICENNFLGVLFTWTYYWFRFPFSVLQVLQHLWQQQRVAWPRSRPTGFTCTWRPPAGQVRLRKHGPVCAPRWKNIPRSDTRLESFCYYRYDWQV